MHKKSLKKWNRIENVMAAQNRGVKNSKNKSLNVTKANSQTPTKFLVCWFIVVKVQR
jgi:hypothetical protein